MQCTDGSAEMLRVDLEPRGSLCETSRVHTDQVPRLLQAKRCIDLPAAPDIDGAGVHPASSVCGC